MLKIKIKIAFNYKQEKKIQSSFIVPKHLSYLESFSEYISPFFFLFKGCLYSDYNFIA